MMCCCWTSSPARAWTTAQIESAHARVEVDAEAVAEVTVLLQLQVRGGWLEGLELAGFDPDLQLNGDTFRFRDENEMKT